MNGNADRTAGLEPADAGSDSDHPQRLWRWHVEEAQHAIADAQSTLGYSTRQEVQAATSILEEAAGHLAFALASREG
jgi:hypothetical protein